MRLRTDRQLILPNRVPPNVTRTRRVNSGSAGGHSGNCSSEHGLSLRYVKAS
eukprot:gene9241-biopygen4582